MPKHQAGQIGQLVEPEASSLRPFASQFTSPHVHVRFDSLFWRWWSCIYVGVWYFDSLELSFSIETSNNSKHSHRQQFPVG